MSKSKKYIIPIDNITPALGGNSFFNLVNDSKTHRLVIEKILFSTATAAALFDLLVNDKSGASSGASSVSPVPLNRSERENLDLTAETGTNLSISSGTLIGTVHTPAADEPGDFTEEIVLYKNNQLYIECSTANTIDGYVVVREEEH